LERGDGNFRIKFSGRQFLHTGFNYFVSTVGVPCDPSLLFPRTSILTFDCLAKASVDKRIITNKMMPAGNRIIETEIFELAR
jgi:hypothetical protein